MIRKTLLALAIGSAFAASMSNVYADGDEEKKPEHSQSWQILAEGDEDKKKPEQPQLV